MFLSAKITTPQLVPVKFPADQSCGPKPRDHSLAVSDGRCGTVGVRFMRRLLHGIDNAATPLLPARFAIDANQRSFFRCGERLSQKDLIAPNDRRRVTCFRQVDPPLDILVRPPARHNAFGGGLARSIRPAPLRPIPVAAEAGNPIIKQHITAAQRVRISIGYFLAELGNQNRPTGRRDNGQRCTSEIATLSPYSSAPRP